MWKVLWGYYLKIKSPQRRRQSLHNEIDLFMNKCHIQHIVEEEVFCHV